MTPAPYPHYKDSRIEWLGLIPAVWQLGKFRYLFSESSELNGSRPVGEMLSVSGYRGVEKKVYDDENRMRSDADLETYRVVRPGQLVVNTMWLNHAGLGISEFTGHVSPAYRSYNIEPGVHARYIHHLMRCGVYVNAYTGNLTGIRPNSLQMSRATLMEWPVLLPPEAEQRQIADYLDMHTAKLDLLIEKQERLINALAERRQAIISHAVTKGLDPNVSVKASPVLWIGEVPVHWNVGNIRRFAQMKTGHTPSRSHPEYWVNCTIPWCTLADVWQLRAGQRYLGETNARISELGLANSAADLLPAGTVVLSRTASVGFTGIMPIPMATSQDYWNWICRPSLEPTFLWYQFQAMRSHFHSLMQGSTHKTIYQAQAAALTVTAPPLAEQQTIVEYLDRETAHIDALSAKAREMISVLKERRQALISAAVTGKIDVRGLS